MPSHEERLTIERYPDGCFSLYCEKLNRTFYGIQNEKELIQDIIRELKLSKED